MTARWAVVALAEMPTRRRQLWFPNSNAVRIDGTLPLGDTSEQVVATS